MKNRTLVIALGLLAIGCGPISGNGRPGHDPNDPTKGPHVAKGLQFSPGDPVLFLDNMMPASQAFTIAIVYEDGTSEDVTAQATVTVDKPDLGTWSGNTFQSNTTGGFTKVTAKVGTNTGYTTITLVPRRLDAMGNPLDFFFIAPYNGATNPSSAILTFNTKIQQADVGFIVDTTGSMASKISALHSSLTSLATSLKASIPSVAMGVADYRSWPCAPDGSPGSDWVYKLTNRIVTVTAGGLTAITSAIGALAAGGGGDGSECGFDALWAAASGQPLLNCNGSGTPLVTAFDPASAPGSVTGEMTGTKGGMGFRAGSLPVFVLATDAELHDADDPADTVFAPIKPYAKGHNAALMAINALGGRFVGIASTGGGEDFSPNFAGAATGGWEPHAQMVWLAQQTNSVVPPNAFGGTCGAGMCCTGVNGAAEMPIMGVCPMVYRVDASGGGLGTSLTDAINKLISFGGYDDGTKVVGNGTDENMNPLPTGHTTADFLAPVDMERGITPLDSMPAVGAAGGPASIDTTLNEFMNVQPGTTLRFTVRAYNDFVPPTDQPQFFKAVIQVVGNGAALLDSREVYILVPPGGDQIL
jgi:hypothetical protein